jgi:hypothetical protein
MRTTAGARALSVLSLVIAVVAVPVLVLRLATGEPRPEQVTTAVVTATTVPSELIELRPIRTDCSATTASACSALTDGDPTTVWSPQQDSAGSEIVFFFSPPVTVTSLTIQNLADEKEFKRHARIAGVEMHLSDTPQAVLEQLPDAPGSQDLIISSLSLSSLTLHITSVYPAEHVDNEEPFDELAVREIEFIGRAAP